MVQRSQSTVDAQLDVVFLALADPTRRAILARLAGREESLSSLAEPFDMSLPAVVKHVRVLERAGLVEHAKVGRERRCRLAPEPPRAAERWLVRYRGFWQGQLDSLSTYMARTRERR